MIYQNKLVFSSATEQPLDLEITETAVYIRTNIQKVEETEETKGITYQYTESKYSKDGYILLQQKFLNEQEAMLVDIDYRLTEKEMEGIEL